MKAPRANFREEGSVEEKEEVVERSVGYVRQMPLPAPASDRKSFQTAQETLPTGPDIDELIAEYSVTSTDQTRQDTRGTTPVAITNSPGMDDSPSRQLQLELQHAADKEATEADAVDRALAEIDRFADAMLNEND